MANRRCRFHGGKSTGAPKGNTNALWNGNYTAAAIAQRKSAAALRRAVNAKIALVLAISHLGKRTAAMEALCHALDAEIAGAPWR